MYKRISVTLVAIPTRKGVGLETIFLRVLGSLFGIELLFLAE